MTTRIYPAPVVQQMLWALRRARLTVKKLSAGYVVTTSEGRECFRAMRGSGGYLVRHDDNLFQP